MKKTINRKNKKHAHKNLPWISVCGILSIGVIVAAPLAVMFMNGNREKPAPAPAPDPEPIVDPTDPNAYKMIEGTDYTVLGSNTLRTITPPSDASSIKFEGPIESRTTPLTEITFQTESQWFKDLKYLEFGEQWNQGSTINDKEQLNGGFLFYQTVFPNKNIAQIVFRETRNIIDENHKFSYCFRIGPSGEFNGNKSYFFDIDLKSINFVKDNDECKVFTIDPESIYIRDGTGTIDEWALALNITNKSIFKIVKKN